MSNIKTPRDLVSPQADRIVKKFGGPRKLAKYIADITGGEISAATVYRWTYSKARNGTGGFIPNEWRVTISQIAEFLDIEITPEDWMHD